MGKPFHNVNQISTSPTGDGMDGSNVNGPIRNRPIGNQSEEPVSYGPDSILIGASSGYPIWISEPRHLEEVEEREKKEGTSPIWYLTSAS